MRPVHGVDGPPRRGLILRAALTSILLSLLFVIVYGSTNWFTAQRPSTDVRVWSFGWESSLIPFVPILIVPYMSMDFLFFFALFFCRDRREQRTLARRVVFAILTAAAFFLALPLKLDWPARPQFDGWFGDFVESSCTAPFLMEYPHNLFPSLHIVLCLLVAPIFLRQLRNISRIPLAIWFVLIGLSTVLTWQHHVVDVLGALVLASFAFYFFRESRVRSSATRNLRIAGYYAAGAGLLVTIAFAIMPWGVFVLWPAAALGITAAGYMGLGASIFRKTDGRLPWSVRIVLAPILIGHFLSLLYYRRKCRACDEVAPGVLVGRVLSDAEVEAAIHMGVTAVLDLTAEFSEAAAFRSVRYLNIPVLDLTAPTSDQLLEAITFIAEEAACGTVYVHCKIGYSRSAAVVGGYLLARGHADTLDEAIAMVRQARPSIVVRPEVICLLRDFAMQMSSEMVLAESNL